MENFVVRLSDKEEKVRSTVETLLDSEGYELVKIKIKNIPGSFVLVLYIDTKEKPNGINIDNLQEISHLISDVLDASFPNNELFDKKYNLEISSPGLDRPLAKMNHFKESIGQKVKIRFKSSEDDRVKNISGILDLVNDNGINITLDTKEIMNLAFVDIIDVNIVFDFSLIKKK